MSGSKALLDAAAADPRNGWSIGTFGAIGEFVRNADETAITDVGSEVWQCVTARGGIRISRRDDFLPVAYETLVSDRQSWGNAVAFCLPIAAASCSPSTIRRLGPDRAALRSEDRDAILFDLGLGIGHVSMCVRTGEPSIVDALDRAEGKALLGPDGKEAGELVRLSSPHRVMLSPAGRVEVYAAIPPPDGKSPEGPHSHLLPKLIATGRTHSANAPIPEGLQPVLMLHPPSPWRDANGKRKPFDACAADAFASILAAHGLEDDRAVSALVEGAVRYGAAPQDFSPPQSRRGRAQMRIALRRMATRIGEDALAPWRELYDPVAIDIEETAPGHS